MENAGKEPEEDAPLLEPGQGRAIGKPVGRAATTLEDNKVLDESDQRLIRNVAEADWIERAMKSPAAVRVDEILGPIADGAKERKYSGLWLNHATIEKLKKEMFQQVYATMGDEMMPEDMVRAVVMKTDRYHPYAACIFTILSLGLFYIFRPRDDEGVLVLTRHERICCYRVIRQNVFENFFNVAKATFYVILVFWGITVLPAMVTETLGVADSSHAETVATASDWLIHQWKNGPVERFQRNTALQVVTYTFVVIYLIFWMWTKFPHDYGTRQRQAHAADKVSCAQFCLQGGKWSRSCRFRLFFGRYPEQGSLDNKMSMRDFGVVGIANKEELSTTSGANPFAGHGRRSLLVYGFFVYYTFMAIDVYLTYVEPPMLWAEEALFIQNFCLRTDMTESMCVDGASCREWVTDKGEKLEGESEWFEWCNELTWINNQTAADANASSDDEGRRLRNDAGGGVVDTASAAPARPRRVTGADADDADEDADSGAEDADSGADADAGADAAASDVKTTTDAQGCDPGTVAPCCAGCSQAYFGKITDNREKEFFGMLVSAVLDISAIALTIFAASAAFNYVESKDHVDMTFKRRAKYSAEIAHFEVVAPLAQDFVNSVLDNSMRQNNGKIPEQGKPKSKRDIDLAYEKARGDDPKQVVKRGNLAFEIGGDEGDGANFQDTGAWEPESNAAGGSENDDATQTEAQDWQEFWNQGKTVIQKAALDPNDPYKKWIPKILIPRKCLGMPEEEKILGAWVEVPMLDMVILAPLLITTMLIYVFMIFCPNENVIALYRLNKWDDYHHDKIGSAAIWCGSFFVIGLILVLAWLYSSTRHAVILTDCRIFYIRTQRRVWWLLKFVPQLRLDVFRHDHEITYGSLMTAPPTPYQRATGAPWTPGHIFIQPGIYGLIRLTRGRGNVMNVYQTVSQLTKPGKPQFLTEKAIQDAGVSVQICRQYVEENMEQVMDHIWRITHKQPDDVDGMMPDVYLAGRLEKPLFYWSFQELGWVNEPHNTNSDVVVTTNRVYLYSRQNWKFFDGYNGCLFACCWCSCFWKLFQGKKSLRRLGAFLDLDMLLSFCTEVDITQPIWVDPKRWPCSCPCLDNWMKWCTLCLTCEDCKGCWTFKNCKLGLECNKKTCSFVPQRAPPRAQLWMMWRHRYNPAQRDLQLIIRPYNMKEGTLVADALSCCYNTKRFVEEVVLQEEGQDSAPNYEKVEMLRKIMGVVQDIAGSGAPEFVP